MCLITCVCVLVFACLSACFVLCQVSSEAAALLVECEARFEPFSFNALASLPFVPNPPEVSAGFMVVWCVVVCRVVCGGMSCRVGWCGLVCLGVVWCSVVVLSVVVL